MSLRLNPATGMLAVVGCALLWSTGGLAIKLVDAHPLFIAAVRSGIAFLFMAFLLPRPFFRLTRTEVIAAIGNTATMLLFVCANKMTSAANAILLQYAAPVWTAILGALILKEKIHKEHVGALISVAVGLLVLFSGSLGGGALVGDLMAFLSSFSFAIFFVGLRKAKASSPLRAVALSHLLTAIAGFSILPLLGTPFIPQSGLDLTALGALAWLGIGQIGISGMLLSWGIQRTSAISANLIAVIEPVFNPVWVFVILGEVPATTSIIGGAIILGSVCVSSAISARRQLLAPDESSV